MILLKLIIAPVLIGLVSLAERKWGASVSGLLVGLPLTSGPILFYPGLGARQAILRQIFHRKPHGAGGVIGIRFGLCSRFPDARLDTKSACGHGNLHCHLGCAHEAAFPVRSLGLCCRMRRSLADDVQLSSPVLAQVGGQAFWPPRNQHEDGDGGYPRIPFDFARQFAWSSGQRLGSRCFPYTPVFWPCSTT